MTRKTVAALAAAIVLVAAVHGRHRVVPAFAQAMTARLTVTGLEANGATEPLGVDDPTPRLTWRLESGRRGVMQTGYRVLVASGPELLRPGAADVWDSGTVSTADPWVLYAGPRLQSRTRYFWSVEVTAPPHETPAWSTRTWPRSRPVLRGRSAGRPTPPATTRCSGGSGPTSTRASSARTGLSRRRGRGVRADRADPAAWLRARA